MLTCEDVLRREFKKLVDKNSFLNITQLFNLNFFYFEFEGKQLDLVEGLVKKSVIKDPSNVQLIKTNKWNVSSPEHDIMKEVMPQLVLNDIYAALIAGQAIISMHMAAVTGVE